MLYVADRQRNACCVHKSLIIFIIIITGYVILCGSAADGVKAEVSVKDMTEGKDFKVVEEEAVDFIKQRQKR